jgi:small subunit ribosomal protein S8e
VFLKRFEITFTLVLSGEILSYYQGSDLRKPSGGFRGKHRKVKRKYELGSPPTLTKIGSEEKRKIESVYGGNIKVRLKEAVYVNVCLPDGVVKKVKVLDVVETPENPQHAKSKIISQGSVVKTELGLVKITSRPGQDGVLNGVLIK